MYRDLGLKIVQVAWFLCNFAAKMAEEAYEQDVIGVDNGYNTYEMRQTFKRESQRRGSNYRYESLLSCYHVFFHRAAYTR